MKISYNSKEDILYFQFKKGPSETVKEVEDNVIVELDQNGEVMGIELWGIRKNKAVLKKLSRIAISH